MEQPEIKPPMSADPIDTVKTQPPTGKKRITNIWWDDATNEFVLDHE